MKRNLLGGVLAVILFICLSLTGNAFANTYAFVLEKDKDAIQIYNVDGNFLAAEIDLDASIQTITKFPYEDNETQADGVIVAVAPGPSGRYWYFVTDNGDTPGKLYQVDVAGDYENNIEQFSVVELTQVGKNPKAVVAGRYGKYVYVANYGSDSVTIYKRKIGAELQTISTKTGFYKPVALDITDGDDVFVVNSGQNTDGAYVVTVFNASSDNIEIALENKPTDILVTPDYQYVYVCNSGATGKISVIKPVDYHDYDKDGDEIEDEGENTVIGTIDIENALPTKMAMIKGGDYIYAIDPVWTETDTDITIASGGGMISIIDCRDRKNAVNAFSENIQADSDLIGIASTKNGNLVYTVGGEDARVFVTDHSVENKTHVESDQFSADSGVFQNIVLGGTMPLAPTFLTAEGEKIGVELEWEDESFDETGFLIYRLDQEDEDKEYKSHLIDTIDSSNVEYYLDDTVRKGKRYTYHVVAFNDVSRSQVGTPVTVKAKDTSDTEICFITGASGDNKMMTVFFAFLTLLFLTAFLVKRKIS